MAGSGTGLDRLDAGHHGACQIDFIKSGAAPGLPVLKPFRWVWMLWFHARVSFRKGLLRTWSRIWRLRETRERMVPMGTPSITAASA